MAYNAVPPPSQPDLDHRDLTGDEKHGAEKPAHVSEQHWKRFQQLKARREAQSIKSTNRRKQAVRRSALKAVRREVSVRDVQDVLRAEGVNITLTTPRNGSRSISTTQASSSTADWQTIKKYLDPNPQLRGIEKGRYAPKSGLEAQLDKAVEEGQFQAASELSDQLAEREADKERKVAKKPALKWRYEHKQRWETKGNM